MAHVYTIAYDSSATIEFGDRELASLLKGTHAHNSRVDITGVLLFRNGRFMQVLEGPEKAVHDTDDYSVPGREHELESAVRFLAESCSPRHAETLFDWLYTNFNAASPAPPPGASSPHPGQRQIVRAML